ncbi:GNAT family N-acetyltransferase [Lentisphaerota bacterium ZTH]|nr:GNAT family N-acetyltransferase [Lentisphaerota bacterium]WET05496.1 GNAT family N-acetyltransferase [Lentisphaerota bacterium ZTH]
MHIRELKPEDLELIAAVHHKAWLDTYSSGVLPQKVINFMTLDKWRKSWEKNLCPCNQDFHLCAETPRGRITAFASFGANLDPANCREYPGRLLRIYVLREFQGQGIGRTLIKNGISWLMSQQLNAMTVHVVEANISACRYYEHLGGTIIYRCNVDRLGYSIGELTYGWPDISSLI